MRIQPKLNEVIFYFNETELLKKRLEYSCSFVENVFIVNFGDKMLNLNDIKVVELCGFKNIENFFDFDNVQSFIRTLINRKIRVEDILIFSNIYDIPDFHSLKNKIPRLSSKPFVLVHQQYFWNHKYVSESHHFGSKIILMSHLMQRPNFFFEMEQIDFPVFKGEEIFQCGFRLNGFEDLDTFTDSFIFWNDLKSEKSYVINKLLKVKNNLTEFWNKKNPKKIYQKKTNIPKIFKFSKNKVTNTPKKILIQTNVSESVKSEYDLNIRISPSEIEVLGIKKYFLNVPKINWYENEENFSNFFVKNETLRILKDLQIQDFDFVYIEKKIDESPSIYTYKKFKSSIPSSLF